MTAAFQKIQAGLQQAISGNFTVRTPRVIDARWYIAKCEPQRERMAMAFLRRNEDYVLEPYCPFEKWRICRSGKWLNVERPLIRGYIFVRAPANPDGWAAVNGSKHILGLVKQSGPSMPKDISFKKWLELLPKDRAAEMSEFSEPAEVPALTIAMLQAREAQGEWDHAAAAEAKRRLLKARRRGSVPLHSQAARERMEEILRVVDA